MEKCYVLREESSNEILQFAIENGMLDEASLLDKIEIYLSRIRKRQSIILKEFDD